MVGTSEAQISRFYSRTHGVQKRLGFVKEGFIGTRWSVQKRSHGKTNLVNGTIAYRIWASASSSQGDRVENAHVSQMKSPSPDAIIQDDRLLETYREHLDYRIDQYNRTLTAIEMHEGSLEEFALGYRKFGFSREDGATVYREWAPGAVGAQLIGDFNDWSGLDMQKNEFGVWSVTIPDHGACGDGCNYQGCMSVLSVDLIVLWPCIVFFTCGNVCIWYENYLCKFIYLHTF